MMKKKPHKPTTDSAQVGEWTEVTGRAEKRPILPLGSVSSSWFVKATVFVCVCFVSFGRAVMVSRWSRSLLSMPNVIPLGFRQEFSLLSRFTYAAVAATPHVPDPVDKPLSNNPTVKLEKLFRSKPSSLALPLDSPLRIEEPNYEGIQRFILKMILFYSKQSKSIRGANVMYKRIVSQVDKPSIYEVFNLEKTFRTTFSVLVLHVWLSLRRLKAEGKEGVEFGQYLYEIYNHDVELRVSTAGVNLLLIRWMKDLEKIFYGNIVAYDSAMLPEAKHDELANAMWRNIFSDDGSPIRVMLLFNLLSMHLLGMLTENAIAFQ